MAERSPTKKMIFARKSALRWKVGLLIALILGLLGLTLAFRLSSLGELIDVQRVVELIRQSGTQLGTPAAITCIALASIAAIPLAAIILISAVAFGPWLGLTYALSGASLGAAICYGVGRHLGHEALCQLAGERVNLLSERLAKGGILSVIIIRMIPIAPFAIVNLIAGSTHITKSDFMIGTFLGMLPGGLVIALMGDYIAEIAASPQGTTTLIAVFLVLFMLGWAGVKYWLKRQSKF